jgi:hypothetical protein
VLPRINDDAFLERDPEKRQPDFPRDKREALVWGSCSTKGFRQLPIMKWKASNGDRPNTAAHSPKDDTSSKSCLLWARSQIGYLGFRSVCVIMAAPRFLLWGFQ